jgi:hypothetical protein
VSDGAGEGGGTLVRYGRSGGRPPADDEHLIVEDDGAYRARRTVAGARVGRFAGRLTEAGLDALRAAVDGVRDAADIAVLTPHDGATEVVEAAGHAARMGSNEAPPQPWRTLVLALRQAIDTDAVADPVAALELRAGTRAAVVAHAGTETLEVDVASVVVRVVRLDAEGAVLGRWSGREQPAADEDSGQPAADWDDAGPGWTKTLPFTHGLELAPGDWLQVWVNARVREPGDPAVRAVRLFVGVPG